MLGSISQRSMPFRRGLPLFLPSLMFLDPSSPTYPPMTSIHEISSCHRADSSPCDSSPFPYHPKILHEIDRLQACPWGEGPSQCSINGEVLGGHPTSEDRSIGWSQASSRLREMITNYEAEEVQGRIKGEEEKIRDRDDYRNWHDRGAPARVCSDCNTTKTPLWRSGPQGPKSLCNACGIRMRKARRAKDALSNVIPIVSPSKVRRKKAHARDQVVPLKKRCRFEEFSVSLGKRPACHRVLAQDERDAALLLMALSCDLIRG
ncbi:uncharacterized protein LOC144703050 [Wolffia australiana]